MIIDSISGKVFSVRLYQVNKGEGTSENYILMTNARHNDNEL